MTVHWLRAVIFFKWYRFDNTASSKATCSISQPHNSQLRFNLDLVLLHTPYTPPRDSQRLPDYQRILPSPDTMVTLNHQIEETRLTENNSNCSYWSRNARRLISLSYCSKLRVNQWRMLVWEVSAGRREELYYSLPCVICEHKSVQTCRFCDIRRTPR